VTNTELVVRVLVAEDEKDIALSYKLVLEQRNHVVFISYNGIDCLKRYRNGYQSIKDRITIGGDQKTMNRGQDSKHKNGIKMDIESDDTPSPFDVVVLDYKMPGKNDMEVAKEILQINPNQRIIFASAYVIENFKGLRK
jgi:CheY-like chemotaxis protein